MDQIEEIRQKTDIVALISQQVKLRKAGRNYKGLCPFHEEKTASFMVSPERQIFKCFGCQEGGDVFSWMMKREGMEFGEALRVLADKAGVELKSYKPDKNQLKREKLLEINHLASEYYHYLLMEHKLGKKALEYLMRRGIRKTSMRSFKLGYAVNEWEGLIKFLVTKKNYRVEELEEAGLVIKSSRSQRGYYDRFRGRVMFSLFDYRGRVVGFAGRVMEKEVKEAKYVNTPETLLYHKSLMLYGLETTKEEIKKENRAIVVEGELDAISSYQAGVKNVVAIKGSALTEEQIELLKRFTENLSLALDEDVAGEMAAKRGIELAEKAGLNVRIIRVKYGKDPDECAQRSARLWKESVKAATPVYDFVIETAVKRYGTKTPEGKKKVSEEAIKSIYKINNQVIKAYYVKKLAEVLEVDEAAVAGELGKKERLTDLDRPAKEKQGKPEEKSREERLGEYILALVLQQEAWVLELANKVETKWLAESAVRKVLKRLQKRKKTKKWKINQFVKSLPAELIEAVDKAYLTDLGRLGDDKEKLLKELERAEDKLRQILVKKKMRELAAKIKIAEKKEQGKSLERLKREFVRVSKELAD